MKPITYLSAGLLGLVLTLDASASLITRSVTLTSPNGLTTWGSFNVNFDDATPAGPCGSACTLSDISRTDLGHSWTASEVTNLSIIFDPATFISSWAVSFAFDGTGPGPDGLRTGKTLVATYTGNADRTLAISGTETEFSIRKPICVRPEPGEEPPPCEPASQVSRSRDFLGIGAWASASPTTSEVPEPATAGLVLAGLGGLLAARRRRAELRA